MKMVEPSEVISELSEYVTVDSVWTLLKRTAYMLYLMNPKEHLYEDVEQVPDYFRQAIPSFNLVIILEMLIRFLRGKPGLRLNDTLTNSCTGMLLEFFKLPIIGFELIVYMWIYNNFRIVTLPWNSMWTWFIGLLLADLAFYWMHRTLHSVSFLWSFHEVHHSSEEYNMTTPLRLHFFTSAALWFAYLPMAFVIPPQVYFVHYQMMVIYQYLLHAEFTPRFSFVNWFLNTPGLHRIHHGRNRKCIDKNFGSVLIIWDRIFGTYEPDTEEHDNINYGVTTPVQTFNPFLLQLNFTLQMYKKFVELKGIKNKLQSLIKGPGWKPGKPWLGNLDDITEPSPDEKKYDPQIPFVMKAYAVLHHTAMSLGFLQIIFVVMDIPTVVVITCCAFMSLSALVVCGIFDARPWIAQVEILRCLLYFAVEAVVVSYLGKLPAITRLTLEFYRILFVGSFTFFIAQLLAIYFGVRIPELFPNGSTDKTN